MSPNPVLIQFVMSLGNLLFIQLRLPFIKIHYVYLVLEAASCCDYFLIALLIAFNLCTFVCTLLTR